MTDVYANGREVSGKATPNKTISALPDVCLSPPPPPAGPVPIPYPNFGTASDTSDGCTSVFVKGKEAGKKNASKYSSIKGDEPATRSFGGSVVSHTITGTLKFAAYSFDVLFEGEGAERFMDLTTTNHMNPGGGASTSVARPRPPKPPSEAECKQMRADLAKERETLSGATADKRATKAPSPSPNPRTAAGSSRRAASSCATSCRAIRTATSIPSPPAMSMARAAPRRSAAGASITIRAAAAPSIARRSRSTR